MTEWDGTMIEVLPGMAAKAHPEPADELDELLAMIGILERLVASAGSPGRRQVVRQLTNEARELLASRTGGR